jgi:hypothetical protein
VNEDISRIADALEWMSDALERIASSLERNRPATTAGRNLLAAIRAAAGDGTFCVRDLLVAAEGNEQLRNALITEIGDLSPRRIGKRFSKLEGQFIDGLSVQRVGEGAGVVWKVSKVSNSANSVRTA